MTTLRDNEQIYENGDHHLIFMYEKKNESHTESIDLFERSYYDDYHDVKVTPEELFEDMEKSQYQNLS